MNSPAGEVSPASAASGGQMLSGLRRRLLLMLILPLVGLALLNAWFEYESADDATLQQDQQLAALLPLLADALVIEGRQSVDMPALLLPPSVAEFLLARPGVAAYAISRPDGRVLYGEDWLASAAPASPWPVFGNEERSGVSWRYVRQKQFTAAGELVLALADASGAGQQWLRSVLLKVLLPHVVLIAVAALAVRWAVERALRPLFALTEAVGHRSPQDLSAIDPQASPEEVRPLVLALNRLFDLVNDQAESQRRFIADAAHQLRTPLAGLQAQVEAWARAARRIAPPGSTGAVMLPVEHVEKLRSATRRTTQLANQLLALSRADERTMAGQPMERVALKPLCESLLEAHLDAATAKQIDLGLEAQEASVPGHAWLLRELLANLVDNAVKYTPPGGAVTIRCGAIESDAFLEVEDDGPGVSPDQFPRLLERFYRVPGTQGEGTGLGLAIADEIARAHRSQLQLGSGPGGRGLRIRLVLPG